MRSISPERGVSALLVLLLHLLLLIAVLRPSHGPPPGAPPVLHATLLRPPPEPPPTPAFPQVLRLPSTFSAPAIPPPSFTIAATAPAPVSTRRPVAVQPRSAGVGADLDLGLATFGAPSGGGADTRATLQAFRDEVKRRILARRRIPPGRHGWCFISYRIAIDAAGRVQRLSLSGCADTELADAARAAIDGASPFPAPPRFATAPVAVAGSMIFAP